MTTITVTQDVTTVNVTATQSGVSVSLQPVIILGGSGGGGAVDSVNGQTGVVVLDTDDIADTATNRYTNDTDITRLANTSGTNTGDQDISGIGVNASAITNLQNNKQNLLNATNIGVFNGALNLSNFAGNYYNTYNLTSGQITFSVLSSTIFGFAYFKIISDGVTEFATKANLDAIFNEQYNLPTDRILPSGEHTVYILKTPNGVAINIPDNQFVPDVVVPTVTSATVTNANPNQLSVLFSEAVNVTNTTGLSFDGDLLAITINSIASGNGTSTVVFNLSANVISGNVGNFVYGVTNTIEDLVGNALVAGSTAVTNNVAGNPTVTSATIENANPNQLVVVFSETVNVVDTTGLSLTGDLSAITIDTIASGSGTNTVTFNLSASANSGDAGNFVYSVTNTITSVTSSNSLQSGSIAIVNNIASILFVVSATVENLNPNQLVVVFNEIVTVTDTTGLSLDGDMSAIGITSIVGGSGTNTITFGLNANVNLYDRGSFIYAVTNNIIDGSSTPLPSGSNIVINNIFDIPTFTLLSISEASNIYTKFGAGGYSGNYAVSTLNYLGAFTFEVEMELSDSNGVFLGLSTNSTNRAFNGSPAWDVGILNGTGNPTGLTPAISGTLQSALNDVINIGAGVKLSMRRDDLNIITVYVNETLVYTFASTLSGNLYLHFSQNLVNSKVYNPITR